MVSDTDLCPDLDSEGELRWSRPLVNSGACCRLADYSTVSQMSRELGWGRFGVELVDLWWTEHDGASTDGAFTQMS